MALILPTVDECSFCDYLSGRRPYTILRRDATTATLVTWEQRGAGHVLVVPIEHRVTILEATDRERHAMIDQATFAARAIVEAFGSGGVKIWQNNGVPAEQSVPHVHIHVAGTVDGRLIDGDVPRLPVEATGLIATQLRSHLPDE